MLEGERLQKVLANQGLASRREIERWIEAGRIKLNGSLAKLGDRYKPGDQLSVDGKPVHFKAKSASGTIGLMYYKPEGEVATRSDEKGRKTVFDKLPQCEDGRWINVGRLDLNTSGLLFFTNNGELANRLMHPSYKIVREYAVRVLGEVSDDMINQLLKGVELEDGEACFESIEDAGGKGSNHWYHVTLREGRNREIRRLWESQGVKVSRLIRIRFGALSLDRKLRAGQHRLLERGELNQLLNEVRLPTIEPVRRHKNPHASQSNPRRKSAGKSTSGKPDKPARKSESPWSTRGKTPGRRGKR